MKKTLTPLLPPEYREWLEAIKTKIRSSQIKAALSVNSELIHLYFDMGRMLDEKLNRAGWGDAVVNKLSADLKEEFPDMAGFSRDNLYFMLRFYRFYQSSGENVEQLVQQIPWGHNILIFRKVKTMEAAIFYLNCTLQNNWSRNILALQIETNLFARQGKALHDFEKNHGGGQENIG